MTVKSNAFRSLKNVEYIIFKKINFAKFENQSLNFGSNLVNKTMKVEFIGADITGDAFEKGTFDGIKKPIALGFHDEFESKRSAIKYVPEQVFKSILNNSKSYIDSWIDYFDCRDY